MSSHIDEAIRIMRANDRGGYTVPTARLYPYQWNWDSAFAALGFAAIDRSRAWQELNMLMSAQWHNGMVPHIVFRRDDPDYFPGPSVWQAGTNPPSSGHSQPPVVASMALRLVRAGDDTDLDQARLLFDGVFAWHRWFYAARDPDQTGLVAIMHPWESGRDNCPDWDSGMDAIVVPDDLGAYHRRDTGHVDAVQRPTRQQYDRYLTIVKFGRDNGWDNEAIYRNGPFLMADPCVQFVLCRANKDLLALARLLDRADAITEISRWIDATNIGNERMWNPEIGCYSARELRTGIFSDGITNASALAHYAGAGSATQRDRMVDHIRAIIGASGFAFPSWDPRHDLYESQRYWRGPVWTMMNWMIAEGLRDYGHDDLANEIDTATCALSEQTGFFEYFDSATGDGCGGPNFTWTAAIYLAQTIGLEAR